VEGSARFVTRVKFNGLNEDLIPTFDYRPLEGPLPRSVKMTFTPGHLGTTTDPMHSVLVHLINSNVTLENVQRYPAPNT
jgi:hypothetical protein